MSGTKRWREQRWLIDNIIQANGIDWDQPRSIYIALPGGPESNADMVGIRARIRKYADAAPAFEAAARRREARAIEFERGDAGGGDGPDRGVDQPGSGAAGAGV